MRFLSARRAVALAATLFVATAGLAYASIPDSAGTIHGCYSASKGNLRVIDSATTSCMSSERGLNWNQTGPPGPQGLPGATGPAGPQGPAGPAGADASKQLAGRVSAEGTLLQVGAAAGVHVLHTPGSGVYSVQSDAGQGWLCDSGDEGTMPLPLVMPFGDDPDIQARVGTFGCSQAGSMNFDVHLWRQAPTGAQSVDHDFLFLVTQSG